MFGVAHAGDYSHRPRFARPDDPAYDGGVTARTPVFAALGLSAALALHAWTLGAQGHGLDADGRRWVDETLAAMSVDEKVGQLVVPTFLSSYTSSDSETYDNLVSLIHEQHIGAIHVFGARTAAPDVLLNPTYARTALGQPLDAASLLNRLQAIAPLPLLVTADFETGAGFRLEGATNFPSAMAFGAAGDPQLTREAGRITAVESRAIGVHVNFAPVVDVNNNPRNPVINIRSFGEDPDAVAQLAAAYIEGLADGGMIATIKHFPGHGDTDIDSHRTLPVLRHPRARLDAVELPPFRAGIAAGAGAVMTGHMALPAIHPDDTTPATLSRPIVTGLLRDEIGFDGLVFTDSMRMRAVTEMASAAEAAGRAVAAGHDLVLHAPNDRAAVAGVRAAVDDGRVSAAALDRSVHRVLEAKARLGLHRRRRVELDTLPLVVGTRAHRAVAHEVSERSITLIRDAGNDVPLRTPRDGSLLYLSVLDRASGWGIGAPSRIVIPELRDRWAEVTAVELSDQSTPADAELVRRMAERYDAVVAGIFVRSSSFNEQMDLAAHVIALMEEVAAEAAGRRQPFVALFFGNPYPAAALPAIPAALLTYDYRGLSEETAVRALAGEIPIRGRLPVTLADDLPRGHGLTR